MRLATSLAKLEGRTQLEFWFAILEALTILIRRPSARGLVLLDNVDPLSEHLQAFLKGTLLDLAQNVSFKVVLPVRVSTFWQDSNAYARSVTWYPHSGPGPVDVITTRIASFITAPDDYPAYLALSPLDQKRAVFRAFELLLRLHRGRGQYRSLGRVVTAIAGDSIRRAMSMMEYLMLTSELKASYESAADVAHRLSDVRKRYELRLLLERIGTATLEELTALAQELPPNFNKELSTWSGKVAARLGATVLAVLENAEHGGARLTDIETQDLIRICATELAGKVCRSSIQVGWRLVIRSAAEQGSAPEPLDQLREGVLVLLEQWLAKPLDDALGGPGVGGVEIFNLIVAGMRAATQGSGLLSLEGLTDDEDDVLKANFDSWDESQLCRRVLLENGPHVAVRALVRSRFVPDVFHDSSQENNVSSGKARLLFVVASQPHGRIELARVLELFGSYNFSKPSVLSFVNDLLSESVRAIWINKAFAYADYQELERDRGRCVQLTRGGWGLYSTVFGELNFLTSVFPPAGQGVKLVGRLEWALNELQAIQNKDLTLLQNWLKSGRTEGVTNPNPTVLNSTALHAAARVARELIWHCRGHFHRVIKKRETAGDSMAELEATREALRRWHRFLRDEAEQLAEIAPPPATPGRAKSSIPALWANRAIDPSHHWASPPHGLDHVRLAAGELREALRSDVFWHPSLAVDEFRDSAN
jgi:hypothetical protein